MGARSRGSCTLPESLGWLQPVLKATAVVSRNGVLLVSDVNERL